MTSRDTKQTIGNSIIGLYYKLLKSKDPVIEQEHDIILVIVDKLTKWGYFIVYIKEISVEDVVHIYTKEIFAKHRALEKIILDRDLRFISAFQEVFLAEQEVKTATFTAYHPQTNNQTEKLNQTLKQYL